MAILKKVAQESDDNELIDLVFEILSSIIVDGKYVFFFCCNSLWEGKTDLSEQLNVNPTSKIELVIFLCLSNFRQLSCNRHFYKIDVF